MPRAAEMAGPRAPNDIVAANIENDVLAEILARIDENLELRSQIGDLSRVSDHTIGRVREFEERLDILRSLDAPRFVIKGRNLQNLAKRMINLVVGSFGYKQLRFNQFLLESLGVLAQGVRESTAARDSEASAARDRWHRE